MQFTGKRCKMFVKIIETSLKHPGVEMVRMDEQLDGTRKQDCEDEDLATVRRILAGDTEAFEVLVVKYQRTIFNAAYRFVGDAHEAEDLTQEIFVKIYSNLSSFAGRSRFFTWLYAIALNHLRSRRKPITRFLRSVTELFTFEGLVDRGASLDEKVEQRETMRALEQTITELPEIYREAVIMRDVNQLSYKEISEMLDLNIESVKTRIHRGRAMLSRSLRKRGF